MEKQKSPHTGRKAGFAAGFLIALFLFVLLRAGQYCNSMYQGVANSRATGLAAVAGGFDNPMALWNSTSLVDVLFQTSFSRAGGTYLQRGASEDQSRKIIRSGNLQIEAAEPAAAAEEIQRIAKRLGGDVLNSSLNNPFSEKPEISLLVHVPAGQLDQLREEIRNLGVYLDSERIEARDVGKDYVDMEATLRNEEAKEAQYLSLLKRASTVHDALEVSTHLSEVRGTIEKTKGEMQYLARQVEMSSLEIVILGESRIGSLNLRPLYRLKTAGQNAISAVIDFVATFVMVLSYLPAILLWVAALFLLAALAWRIIRWLWRILGFRNRSTV